MLKHTQAGYVAVGLRPAHCPDHLISARLVLAAFDEMATSSGWETIATWPDGTSMVAAPMRVAKWRWCGRDRLVWRRRGTSTGVTQAGTPITSGGRRQRLLNGVHDPCLDRVESAAKC